MARLASGAGHGEAVLASPELAGARHPALCCGRHFRQGLYGDGNGFAAQGAKRDDYGGPGLGALEPFGCLHLLLLLHVNLPPVTNRTGRGKQESFPAVKWLDSRERVLRARRNSEGFLDALPALVTEF